jgi:hypothetical protein
MLMGRVREGARPLWLECSGDVSTIFYICGLRVVSTPGLLVFSVFVVGAACIPIQDTPEMVRLKSAMVLKDTFLVSLKYLIFRYLKCNEFSLMDK